MGRDAAAGGTGFDDGISKDHAQNTRPEHVVRYFSRPQDYWAGQTFNMSKHLLVHDQIRGKYPFVRFAPVPDQLLVDDLKDNKEVVAVGVAEEKSSKREVEKQELPLARSCGHSNKVRVDHASLIGGPPSLDEGGPAKKDTIATAIHQFQTQEFLQRVEREYFPQPGKAVAEFEVPVDEEVFANEMRDVRGTLLACLDALRGGGAGGERAGRSFHVGFNVGGGSHHACPGWGEGYCVLNDVALALQILRQNDLLPRGAAIFDLDVHQGNGSACFFPRVYTGKTWSGTDVVEKKVVWDYERSKFVAIRDPEVLAYLRRTNGGMSGNDLRGRQTENNSTPDGSRVVPAPDIVLDHLYRKVEVERRGVEKSDSASASAPNVNYNSRNEEILLDASKVEVTGWCPHPYVKTVSLHEENNFPHFRVESTLDVGLATGLGDVGYLREVEAALQHLGELTSSEENKSNSGCTLDLLVYVAGADPFEKDTLGGLCISKEGLRARDRLVFEWCKGKGVPVAVVLAGGYAEDVRDVADIHFGTFEEMKRVLYMENEC
eukprot:g9560.t1